MLFSFLVCIYIAGISIAYGIVVVRLLGLFFQLNLNERRLSLPLLFLLGLSILVVLVNAVSLLAPVGFDTHIYFIALVLVCFTVDHRWLLKNFRRLKPAEKISPFLILLIVTSMLFLLAMSAGPMNIYDTGLYHIQAIRWIESFRAVPGLGNLYGRLAFNSSWMAINAFFRLAFLGIDSFRVLNTCLLVGVFAYFIRKIQHLLTNRFSLSNVTALWMTLFLLMFYPGDSSYNTDLAGSMYAWMVILLFMESFEDRQLAYWKRILVVIFACTAVTIKLSNLPLMILVLLVLYRIAHPAFKKVLPLIGVMIVLFFPWMIRNVVLSGCLVYPITWLRIPGLDWVIPKALVQQEYDLIKSWARIPCWDPSVVLRLDFREWFSQWVNTFGEFGIFLVVTGFLGNFVMFIGRLVQLAKKKLVPVTRDYFGLHLVFVLFFLYWFINAPDLRFGVCFLVPAFSVAVYPVLHKMKRFPINTRYVLVVVFVAFCQVMVIFLAQRNIDSRYIQYMIQPADVPAVQLSIAKKLSSATVYRPLSGELCWDAPIPCTPMNVDNLEMRGKTLQDGFYYAP